MGKMVSELSKKVGRERQKGNKDKTRDALFRNSSFVNKITAIKSAKNTVLEFSGIRKNTCSWGPIGKTISPKVKRDTHLSVSSVTQHTRTKRTLANHA
jgi:hypothetical protein